jgi:hypothetical protein
MTPNSVNEPTFRAAFNQAESKPILWKRRILPLLPLPVGCYFFVQGLLLVDQSSPDPQSVLNLANGLLRGLYFMGGFSCVFLSLRTYFKKRRSRQ